MAARISIQSITVETIDSNKGGLGYPQEVVTARINGKVRRIGFYTSIEDGPPRGRGYWCYYLPPDEESPPRKGFNAALAEKIAAWKAAGNVVTRVPPPPPPPARGTPASLLRLAALIEAEMTTSARRVAVLCQRLRDEIESRQ